MGKIDQHPNAMLNEAVTLIVQTELRRLGITGPVGTAPMGPRELRIAAGMKLRDLAAKSGISHVTISNLENGKIKDPRTETVDAIARALGIGEPAYRYAVAQTLAQKKPAS